MEFRKIFDTIPEQFDKYRPRYCAELFDDLIEYAGIGPGKQDRVPRYACPVPDEEAAVIFCKVSECNP